MHSSWTAVRDFVISSRRTDGALGMIMRHRMHEFSQHTKVSTGSGTGSNAYRQRDGEGDLFLGDKTVPGSPKTLCMGLPFPTRCSGQL